MIFVNDTEKMALNLDSDTLSEVRFHLVCSTTGEVKKHFQATFKKIKNLKAGGYSFEAVKPFKDALKEILIELRVRGLEADAAGKLYKPRTFVPVPDAYKAARLRQMARLRSLREEQLISLCNSTLKTAMLNAGQNSKATSAYAAY